jgi:hypothetical protein
MRRLLLRSPQQMIAPLSLSRHYHSDFRRLTGPLILSAQNTRSGINTATRTTVRPVQLELQRVWTQGGRRWESTTTEEQRSKNSAPQPTPQSSSSKPSSGTTLNNPKPVVPTSLSASSSHPNPPSNNPSNASSNAPPSNNSVQKASASTVTVPAEPKGPLLPRIWTKVKKEANHYWDGTKLLGAEIKVSARLQYKILQGGKLTRREKRQVRMKCQYKLDLHSNSFPFSWFGQRKISYD